MHRILTLVGLFLLAVSCQSPDKAENQSIHEEPNLVIYALDSAGAPAAITRMIHEAKSGNIWFTTFDGIYRYDGENYSRMPDEVSTARFFSLLEDVEGNLWFGSIGDGVYKFDGKDFQHITSKDGLYGDEITFIFQDSEGKIWFGANGGFSRYDGQCFQNYKLEAGTIVDVSSLRPTIMQAPPKPDNQSINEVNSIIEDRDGLFWIATRGGTFTFDGDEFKKLEHEDGPFANNRWILEDSLGDIWLGGHHGLWRFKDDAFTKISDNFIGYIFEDKAGNIWTSSDLRNGNGWGLSKIPQMQLASVKPEFEVIISGEGMVFGIEESSDGSIWYGTLEGSKRLQGQIFGRY